MVLVDTSIWIRFIANKKPYAAELDALLERGEVVGHDLIFGELLAGDSGGRAALLSAYEMMHQAAPVPHPEVVAFVRHRKLFGRGAGWIDLHLLASTLVERGLLWTADARLRKLAEELRVQYSPADLH